MRNWREGLRYRFDLQTGQISSEGLFSMDFETPLRIIFADGLEEGTGGVESLR
jgi:hypothetical protein